MSNDIRIVKFGTLIKNVNNALLGYKRESYDPLNTSLALVFDYDKLNDYGKEIFNSSSLDFYVLDVFFNKKYWKREYKDIHAFKDNQYKIEAAKVLVEACGMEYQRKEAYAFVFFAMMVLTVDKTDAEEHLTLICDFARLLKITDDEMEDMLMVIRVLYHEVEPNSKFKSNSVLNVFSKVLSLSNN